MKGGDDEPDGDIDTGVDGVDDAGGNGDANTKAFEEERPESICESNSLLNPHKNHIYKISP